MQKAKHYVKNIFVRIIRIKKLLNIIEIRNSSKISLFKHIKITKKYKIATFINNIIKKLANTYKL